jgi:acetylornithine/succinyldiaminopimelate/putrescine aminotransferase
LLTTTAEQQVVRITPPLVIERGHVEEALDIMSSVAQAWAPAEERV